MIPSPNQTLDKSYTIIQTTTDDTFTPNTVVPPSTFYMLTRCMLCIAYTLNTIFLCHLGKFQTPKCCKGHANKTSKLGNVCNYHSNEGSKVQNAANARQMKERNSKMCANTTQMRDHSKMLRIPGK